MLHTAACSSCLFQLHILHETTWIGCKELHKYKRNSKNGEASHSRYRSYDAFALRKASWPYVLTFKPSHLTWSILVTLPYLAVLDIERPKYCSIVAMHPKSSERLQRPDGRPNSATSKPYHWLSYAELVRFT